MEGYSHAAVPDRGQPGCQRCPGRAASVVELVRESVPSPYRSNGGYRRRGVCGRVRLGLRRRGPVVSLPSAGIVVPMSIASPLEPPSAAGATSTALEDPRTRALDPVLARLVLAGRISADAAVRAMAMAQDERKSLAAMVTSLQLISGQDWAEAVARHYEFQLVAAEDMPREPLFADTISPRFMRLSAILPILASDTYFLLA